MKTESTQSTVDVINSLQRDVVLLRSALIAIVGASEKSELEKMKVTLEAMRMLGIGTEKQIGPALAGVEALLDTI